MATITDERGAFSFAELEDGTWMHFDRGGSAGGILDFSGSTGANRRTRGQSRSGDRPGAAEINYFRLAKDQDMYVYLEAHQPAAEKTE